MPKWPWPPSSFISDSPLGAAPDGGIFHAVTVVLKPINLGHNFPRTFTLSADNPEFRIGRASKRDVKNRTAATDNGWFDSGVMSREHATFSICPEKKVAAPSQDTLVPTVLITVFSRTFTSATLILLTGRG